MTEDRIIIKNIHADILIGINPEEREFRQPVIINVILKTDCSVPGSTDCIRDAVDYSVIHDEIVNHLNSTHYDLIEGLAAGLADICLKDSRVAECTVAVDKPDALEFAESVSVEITRKRQ